MDTTYVLPLFGIDIILTPNFKDELKSLWKNGIPNYRLYLPAVCLIETMYKLDREYRKSKNNIILKRYSEIIPTVTTSKIIEIVHSHLDPMISKIAIALRIANLTDLTDCWIGATAAAFKGILLTEDHTLNNILKMIPETKNIVCWSWADLQNHLDK